MSEKKVKPPEGFKFGRMRKFKNYCRQVRICLISVDDGFEFSGFNTITGEIEHGIVFKKNKKDAWESICYDLKKIT